MKLEKQKMRIFSKVTTVLYSDIKTETEFKTELVKSIRSNCFVHMPIMLYSTVNYTVSVSITIQRRIKNYT